ncbi:crossover junction endodeoxyribonuclease RuvC [Candidatus Roizmanbacteria bacterium CG02_land_8_20_14_3_00_36_15]|uniref:Crossover junction endodeoxyribonuclease RuvC n=1 Tax=Candidatus Roizmanbacteria bacterium CG10_big_fil_rev_8_21_14_0_10_36_26 TaxID=1974851 RepID=A0A2M8KLB6_9BACT|nr:MAG: crossover junction endodeoxyribonuclease RuvC [Candidatus Roizmanbacteria bacterium CG03_land_8_20_14_0_80_36_21]PIV37378.1 MAG: crossover junction endodeoxyribonuclease RuvC [Candidatus Roizmanbacteria bacterium CG02_land_8_20_14_3_00_36_15]PIY70107.1 MAG: crossover junction endodeoxyribonuclease RuvC [Candidatus Roizmanbacteria bacterium CG_4_10_14_0_8_um_filter_36_36]PJA52713.1 MAG: crossover junction endodeoxyribonuclease RuvC [Candidatus Roizmanbacteria bacterium CG_4_9_14_3_um_filt
MYILSIDPGLEKTGYAIFKKNKKDHKDFKFITSGLITTDKNLEKPSRLNLIYENLHKILLKYKPAVVVIEEIFFFRNQKTAVTVSQAQGVILLATTLSKSEVVFLTPLQIKQCVTGYGLADKKAIKKMLDLTLHINKKGINDDEYDAIACGLAYCFESRSLLK